ncbi:hypothetical protein LJR164_003502 [Phenylobacterium sp. LjRoot164]|uniref:hypothetical protein n=1 Tax=unclassified Phenylobacterium TaxID=2640670 RepID=UPI003ECCE2BD
MLLPSGEAAGRRPAKAKPEAPSGSRPLRSGRARSKAGRATPELPMTAILTILAFIVVIGGLNYFEFGRLD